MPQKKCVFQKNQNKKKLENWIIWRLWCREQVIDYQRGPFWIGLFTEHLYSKFWVGRSVRAEAKIYFSNIVLKNFNHAGCSTDKMASTKNPVKNNFSSLPLLRPKNRQSFAGGRPPGVFIEAWGYPYMVFPVKIQSYLIISSNSTLVNFFSVVVVLTSAVCCFDYVYKTR